MHRGHLRIILFAFGWYLAGVIAAIPLYTTFWWWDLFAHAASGGMIALLGVRLELRYRESLTLVAGIAILWEAVEPRLPVDMLGFGLITGDAPSDIVATVAGAVCMLLVVGATK